MEDGIQNAPQPPPVIQPVASPAPPVQLLPPPRQPVISPMQQIPPAPMPQLNWSHFKPEFADKPDEYVEDTSS